MVRRVEALLAGIAIGVAVPAAGHADVDGELAAMAKPLPPCAAERAHCIGIQLHVAVAGSAAARGGTSSGSGAGGTGSGSGAGAAGGAGGGSDGNGAGREDASALIAQPAWFATQLAEANRHFAPIDVGFQVVAVDALPASAGHVATRAERDAVSEGRLTGTVIHVFITGKLDDVDEPGGVIRGVTWHLRGSERKYVILSTAAPDRVLAHELGHVFGLPHSRAAISIMNKTPREQPPPEQRRFADDEFAAMKPVLQRLLRDRIIADLAH